MNLEMQREGAEQLDSDAPAATGHCLLLVLTSEGHAPERL